MDKEWIEKLGNYKYRPLNYNEWIKYVAEKYKETALKNINRKARQQKEQIKENVIQFCTR